MLKLLTGAAVALTLLIAPAQAAAKKIALVLPGPITDGTFNSAANKGIEAAKAKYDIEVVIRENTDFAQIEEVLRSYAEEGYDMVIGHGFQFGEPVMNIHADYPKTFFVVNTAQVVGRAERRLLRQSLGRCRLHRRRGRSALHQDRNDRSYRRASRCR